ncbi:MAG: hypothetical protein AAF907_15155 [Planctomycetota bacterium]
MSALPTADPDDRKPVDPNRYPAGWDGSRVQDVLSHYEGLSDEEWIAEDEAAEQDTETHCRITIPKELLPEVRALLSKRAA